MPPFRLHAFQYLATPSPHSYWFRWSDLFSKGVGKDDFYLKHTVKMLNIMLGICSWKLETKRDMKFKKMQSNHISKRGRSKQ